MCPATGSDNLCLSANQLALIGCSRITRLVSGQSRIIWSLLTNRISVLGAANQMPLSGIVYTFGQSMSGNSESLDQSDAQTGDDITGR